MWNMLWPVLVVVVIMRALLEESHGILRFAQDDTRVISFSFSLIFRFWFQKKQPGVSIQYRPGAIH